MRNHLRGFKTLDYFKLVKHDNQFIGFMIGLLPNRPYNSVNYKWFEKSIIFHLHRQDLISFTPK